MTSMDNESPSLESLQDEIDTARGTIDADDVNSAYLYLKIIDRAHPNEKPLLLQYLVEHAKYGASSKEIKVDPVIQRNDLDQLRKRYASLVDDLLEIILTDNPPAPEFYARLCALLDNPALADDRARAFALHWILVDKRVPYFQLDEGLRVSNEDWRALSVKLQTERAKLRFILASDFEQKSEEADLVLRVLDDFGGLEKVRLMGSLIWELREEVRTVKAMIEMLRR